MNFIKKISLTASSINSVEFKIISEEVINFESTILQNEKSAVKLSGKQNKLPE